MTNNKLLLASVPVLSALLIGATAHASPVAGTNELRLDSAYFIPGVEIRGLSVEKSSDSQSSTTVFGASIGVGRFLTDNLELGAALKYFNLDGDLSGFGVAPFARAYTMVSDMIGTYAEVSMSAHIMSPDSGDSRTLLTAGIDLGAEAFFTDSWALRVAPNFRYMHISGTDTSDSQSDRVFGINWGIAAYF